MTILYVTKLTDTKDTTSADYTGSLRQALTSANAGDTIQSQVTGQLTLIDSIEIPNPVSIDFSGLTISCLLDPSNPFSPFLIESNGPFVVTNGHFTQCVRTVFFILIGTNTSPVFSMSNCTFDGVVQQGSSNGYALAVSGNTSGMQLSFTDNVFKNAASGAGVISFSDRTNPTINILRCVFENNVANIGSAIIQMASPSTSTGRLNATIDSCTFTNNRTPFGTIWSNWAGVGTLTVIRSTFSNNQATSVDNSPNGGALRVIGSNINVVVDSSTFVGNSAKTPQNGGAIYSDSAVQLYRSTLARNSRGIRLKTTATIQTYSSIISNNTDYDVTGGLYTSMGYNVYGNISSPSLILSPSDVWSTDPGLADLADNGGPTHTMALRVGSAAFNRNSDNSNPNPSSDQRQPPFLRNVGGAQDAGAYERQALSSLPESVSIYEDTPKDLDVTGMFSTCDGSQVTVVGVAPSTSGLIASATPTTSPTAASVHLVPAQDQNGVIQLAVTGADAFGIQATNTLTVTVIPVNDPPTFTKGSDVSGYTGSYAIPSWATNIAAGPPDEAGQTIQFVTSVTVNSGDLLFTSAPTIDASGNLSFATDSNTSGVATVTVFAQDNGGVDNGGIDTSAAQTFQISLALPPSSTSAPSQSQTVSISAQPSSVAVSPSSSSAAKSASQSASKSRTPTRTPTRTPAPTKTPCKKGKGTPTRGRSPTRTPRGGPTRSPRRSPTGRPRSSSPPRGYDRRRIARGLREQESGESKLQKDILQYVDPTSALLLGMVAAKMTTNLWSWATSTFSTILSPKNEKVSLMTTEEIELCQELLRDCETKIALAKAASDTESNWLLYSLEDLRDDIKDALENNVSGLDASEFTERMEAIVEDFCSSSTIASMTPVTTSTKFDLNSVVCALPEAQNHRLAGHSVASLSY